MPIHFTRSTADTLYVPQVSGSSSLAANFVLASANGVYDDTLLTMTLPSAGTYRLAMTVRSVARSDAGNARIQAKLYNVTDAADITNGELQVWLTDHTGFTYQTSGTTFLDVTVNGSKVINLYAQRNASTSWVTSIIASDVNGRTTISYLKISN